MENREFGITSTPAALRDHRNISSPLVGESIKSIHYGSRAVKATPSVETHIAHDATTGETVDLKHGFVAPAKGELATNIRLEQMPSHKVTSLTSLSDCVEEIDVEGCWWRFLGGRVASSLLSES